MPVFPSVQSSKSSKAPASPESPTKRRRRINIAGIVDRPCLVLDDMDCQTAPPSPTFSEASTVWSGASVAAPASPTCSETSTVRSGASLASASSTCSETFTVEMSLKSAIRRISVKRANAKVSLERVVEWYFYDETDEVSLDKAVHDVVPLRPDGRPPRWSSKMARRADGWKVSRSSSKEARQADGKAHSSDLVLGRESSKESLEAPASPTISEASTVMSLDSASSA